MLNNATPANPFESMAAAGLGADARLLAWALSAPVHSHDEAVAAIRALKAPGALESYIPGRHFFGFVTVRYGWELDATKLPALRQLALAYLANESDMAAEE